MNGWGTPITGADWFRSVEGRMRRIERHKHGIDGIIVVDPIDASITGPEEDQSTAEIGVPEGLSYEGTLSDDLPDVPMQFGLGMSVFITDESLAVGSEGRSSFFLKEPVNDLQSLGSLTDSEIGDTRYVDEEGSLYWWDGLYWQDGGHIKGSPGPAGEPGLGINLKGSVEDPSQLPESAEPNDAYVSTDNDHLWVWDGAQWVDVGPIKGPQGEQGLPGPVGPQGRISILPSVQTMAELPTEAAANDMIYVEETGTLFGWDVASQHWYTIGYIKGEPGPAGADGEVGTGMVLVGTVDTREDLPAAGTDVGEAYLVEATSEFAIWGSDGAWHFVAGVQGPQGIPGPQGDRGPVGVGIPGRDGEDGTDGLSAYDIFVEQGGEGTEEEWLASLQGPPGEDGKDADFDLENLLPAITDLLPELIDTQGGNTLILGQNEGRLYVPVTTLPGMVSIQSTGDFTVTATTSPPGAVPGMQIEMENPSPVYDMKVQVLHHLWINGVATIATYVQPTSTTPATFNMVSAAQGRQQAAAYDSVRGYLHGTIKAGQSATFTGNAWLSGTGSLVSRYHYFSVLPLGFEEVGASRKSVYTFGPGTPAPVATTTAITGTPATLTVGTPINFTATVTPASAVGKVQFQYQRSGTGTWTNFSSPVTVSGGKALLNWPHGTGTILTRAVFTATDGNLFKNSTSNSVTNVIKAAVVDKTATNLPAKNRVRTYKGSGAVMDWNWDGRKCYYGYYDGTNGDQRSLALFEQPFINLLRSMPANSIYEITLTFTNLHTYPNAGTTMRVQLSGDTALPGSQGPITTANAWSVAVPKSGGVTTKVPAALLELTRTNGTGFRFGAATSGTNGYGYLDGLTVKVVVKYRA